MSLSVLGASPTYASSLSQYALSDVNWSQAITAHLDIPAPLRGNKNSAVESIIRTSFSPFCRCAADGADDARLLADDDREHVALFGDADRRAVTRAQLLGNVHLLRQRQKATCRQHPLSLDDDRAVMQRALGAEYALQESRRDHRLQPRAGIENVRRHFGAYDDDQCADVVLRHVLASLDDLRRTVREILVRGIVFVMPVLFTGTGDLAEDDLEIGLIDYRERRDQEDRAEVHDPLCDVHKSDAALAQPLLRIDSCESDEDIEQDIRDGKDRQLDAVALFEKDENEREHSAQHHQIDDAVPADMLDVIRHVHTCQPVYIHARTSCRYIVLHFLLKIKRFYTQNAIFYRLMRAMRAISAIFDLLSTHFRALFALSSFAVFQAKRRATPGRSPPDICVFFDFPSPTHRSQKPRFTHTGTKIICISPCLCSAPSRPKVPFGASPA